jgi:hypothetical protein
VNWSNDVSQRINYFGSLEDAQRWIIHQSANWLEVRAETQSEVERPMTPRTIVPQISRPES